jgi:hypothetical protein
MTYTTIEQPEEKTLKEEKPIKREHHWFKVFFGKWDEGAFDPATSSVCVSAWTALHAAKKAVDGYQIDRKSVV